MGGSTMTPLRMSSKPKKSHSESSSKPKKSHSESSSKPKKSHSESSSKLRKKSASQQKKAKLSAIQPMTVSELMRRSGTPPVKGGSAVVASTSDIPTLIGVADSVISGIRAKIESLLIVESAILKVLDDTDKLRSIVTMQELLGSTISHIRGTNTDLQSMMSVLSSTIPDDPVEDDMLEKLGGTTSGRTVADVLGGVLAATNIYGGKS